MRSILPKKSMLEGAITDFGQVRRNLTCRKTVNTLDETGAGIVLWRFPETDTIPRLRRLTGCLPSGIVQNLQ
jgi:hypothetical protein